MGPRILLCAGMDWPFPARLAQAFAALGARAEALCPRSSPLRRSSAPARLHKFSFLDPLPAIAAAVEKSAPDLIIPCDDLMAELLWRLGQERAEFAPVLHRSLGAPQTYPLLATRNVFLAQAALAGVPVAENGAIGTEADLDRAAARLGLPLVVKTDSSWGGAGVAIAHDIDAARAAFAGFSSHSPLRALVRALKRREPHFLVRMRFAPPVRLSAQRYIAGRPATSALACWQGRLVAANHFDVVVPDDTRPATVVARTDCAAMEEAASRLARHFGLSGLYGLDYMRGEDDKVLLLEINPRATPTSHLALGPGRDLVAGLLSAAGYPVPDRPAMTSRLRIALFPQELRRDPQSPYLAEAYHDLPVGDPALTRALAPPSHSLTAFSQDFSGLPGLQGAPSVPRR